MAVKCSGGCPRSLPAARDVHPVPLSAPRGHRHWHPDPYADVGLRLEVLAFRSVAPQAIPRRRLVPQRSAATNSWIVPLGSGRFISGIAKMSSPSAVLNSI